MRLILLLLISLLLPSDAGAQAFDRGKSRLLSELVRLPDGDSARLLATGPTDLRSGPVSLMVVFDPFISLADSLAVRRKAFALFLALGTRVSSIRPFVLLRAQHDSSVDPHSDHIIEWHDDDRWYAPGGVIERVE